MPRHQLSATVDSDLLSRLDRLAEAEGESRSEIVNQVLRQGLAAQKAEALQSFGFAGAGLASLTFIIATSNLLHLGLSFLA